jgi:hypothetical protein
MNHQKCIECVGSGRSGADSGCGQTDKFVYSKADESISLLADMG